MGKILGFDLSTTVVGYTILDDVTCEVEKMFYYKFESEELIDRGRELEDLLVILFNEFDITTFGIEENLKSFRAGGTNASAMLNTSKLNFLCQYLVKNYYRKDIVELNVNNARSLCFPGFHKIAKALKGKKHKEIIFDMAIDLFPIGTFPKKVLKSGPRKGEEVYLDEAMDMADSWVIAKAVVESNKPKIEKITKSKKKRA